MGGWRDEVLKEFTAGAARLTLVADPDGLLMEEGILHALGERGFEVLVFEEPVSFRFVYESRYKSRQRESSTGLVVVVRGPDLRCLPYDLWQMGRKLCFGIADMFPRLSYSAVTELDRGEFEVLYDAYSKYCSEGLGVNATKDFILRHVFGIVPELIKRPEDLLHVLLRRHYRGQHVPQAIDERFIQRLRTEGRFDDWPLEEIVSCREAFLGFLQERWPLFVDRLACNDAAGRIGEPGVAHRLRYPGPSYLPFDHDDVKPYVDTLFVEGHLTPVSHPMANRFNGRWVQVGVRRDPVTDRRYRFDRLANVMEESLPQGDSRYQDWLTFARRWAELTVLRFQEAAEQVHSDVFNKYENLRQRVDSAFSRWVLTRYSGLHNQPGVPPVMVHHIPRYLVRVLEKGLRRKVALIVIDGLALDQWLVMRDVFSERWPQFHFEEQTVFAWIPTLTPISRQSICAGKPPLFFPDCIGGTDKEESLWVRFWFDQGMERDEVAYLIASGDAHLDRMAESMCSPETTVLGLVVRKIDEIMHGMTLGTAGMHNQVRQWASSGSLRSLMELLIKEGFAVYLTSDHGNLEACGCGLPGEGSLADYRGHRARVYPSAELRSRVKERFPDAISWEPIGLPEECFPLIASDRHAFAREGEQMVCHGGISIEEVIVPFIQVEQIGGSFS